MKRKAGRVDRNDVKARAAAMRQKKAAAEAAKQKAAAAEEAKRQRSMMPPPPPMAPKQPKTLPSKKVTLPEAPLSINVVPTLPADEAATNGSAREGKSVVTLLRRCDMMLLLAESFLI